MSLIYNCVAVEVYRPLTDQSNWSGSFSLVVCASGCCAGNRYTYTSLSLTRSTRSYYNCLHN